MKDHFQYFLPGALTGLAVTLCSVVDDKTQQLLLDCFPRFSEVCPRGYNKADKINAIAEFVIRRFAEKSLYYSFF